VYDTGVVSSSGIGDGSYELQVCKMDGMIHGFKIIFIDMEDGTWNQWEDDDEE